MKITVYELLGLIKDNKAPKHFKYDDYIWTYNYESSAYWNGKGTDFEDYMDDGIINYLNDIVEIIEEKETKPSEEEIEAFKEQFNTVWNSIKAVLGGILEALIKLDKQEVVKKVLEKENNKIEKIERINDLFQIEQDLDLSEFITQQKVNNAILKSKVNELIDVINESRGKDEN